MRKLFLLFGAALMSASVAFAGDVVAEQSTLKVDTKASKVFWNAKKVTGEHHGQLSIAEGTLYLKGDKLNGAEIKLDMTTIDCSDLEGEWKDKLVGHLKSDDFFSVESNPHANFKVKSVKKEGDGHQLTGDLTIKGITHEISFPADVAFEGEKLTARGTATVDRTKYDIKYRSGKFFSDLGDNLIYDNFEIKFELVASVSEEISMR